MTLGLGVLGVAEITPLSIFRELPSVDGIALRALASRRAETAAAQAARHGLDCACTDYDTLLAMPGIDWIYLPAANVEHREWTARALQRGRHVLVEKPAVLREADVVALRDLAVAHRACLVEAVMTRHHPWQAWLRARAHERTWGRLRASSTLLRHGLRETDHFRLQPGGGVLWDDGVYWLQALQAVTDADLSTATISEVDADHAGVPSQVRATLVLDDGVRADFEAAFALPRRATHRFVFEHATVVMQDFFRARIGRHRLHLDIAHASGETERVSFEKRNDYRAQLQYLVSGAAAADWQDQWTLTGARVALIERLHARLATGGEPG